MPDSKNLGDGGPPPPPNRRLAPVPPEEWSPETAELLSTMPTDRDGNVLNLFATLAHHPRLLKRWSSFGGMLLMRGELPERDRELLILRTSWNTQAGYEWAHHVEIGRDAGLTDEEIERVPEGPDAVGWSAHDARLLRAADELHQDSCIADSTWSALAERYTEPQLIEVCMLAGQYHLVAFTLRSLGIQLEGT